MKLHPLAVFLPTLALLSCDRSEIVDSSASKTFTLAPRIVSANGVSLPAVDLVRIVVLNANSPTASPYYDKSLDYQRHGDTIEGIPQNAQLEVRVSGVKIQRDSSRAVWWSGKAAATFSGTQTVDAQSLPVPVFTGDTAAPRIISRPGDGDTIENTDTAVHLVWHIREDSAFTAVANGDTLRRFSDGSDSVVWQHAWSGKSLPVSLPLRDKTGNLSRDSLTVIRRDQVALPTVITGAISGTYHTYQTLRLATATPNAIIRYTLDGTDPVETSLLYADSILIDTSRTIKARAFKTGLTSSSIVSAQYVLSLGKISISIPVSSALWSTKKILLTSDNPYALIRCTTDGSDAGLNSPLCNDSITVSDGATVKAIAYSTNYPKLSPISATFTYPSIWNTAITYRILLDSRDGKSYRTVKIGTQIWMAQNLNYSNNTTGSSDTVGVCYNNSADLCAKYGRLYTWAEVMAGSTSSASIPSGVQGIYPSGWHVPSDA